MAEEKKVEPKADKISPEFWKEMTGRDTPAPEVKVEETTSTTTVEKLDEQKPVGKTEKTAEKTEEAPPEKKRRRAKGYEDVPEIVSGLKSATEAMTAAAEKISAPKQTKPDEFQYTDKEKRQLEIISEMESLFPEKYKGRTENAKRFIQTVEAYEEKLKKDKPEITDDEVDEELATYREKVGAVWDEDDYDEAKLERRLKPIRAEKEKLEEQVGKIVKTDRQGKLAPVARDYSKRVIKEDVLPGLGDEFNGMVGEDGEIVKSFQEKLETDDPLIAELVVGTIDRAKTFSEACVLAFNGGQTELMNQVVDWAKRAEVVYSRLPKEEQFDDNGRKFSPRAAWSQMDPAMKEKHWVVGPDEIIPLATDGLIKSTKEQIAKIKARDQKKYPAPVEPKKIDKPVSPSSTNTPPPIDLPGSGDRSFREEMKRGTITV